MSAPLYPQEPSTSPTPIVNLLVRRVEACLDFEIVNRAVLDDWHAAFERCYPTIFEHSTHHRIERKKQTPSLPRHRIAEIPANIGIGIEREEPAMGKIAVQGRRQLEIAA